MQWQIAEETTTENREKTATLSLIKDCLAIKLDLLSSATVVDRAVRFVENHRNQHKGLIDQNRKVAIDDTTELE
jgi:hypothetical protein